MILSLKVAVIINQAQLCRAQQECGPSINLFLYYLCYYVIFVTWYSISPHPSKFPYSAKLDHDNFSYPFILLGFNLSCINLYIYRKNETKEINPTLNNSFLFLFYSDFHSLACAEKLFTKSNEMKSIKIKTNANTLAQREQIISPFVQVKYTISLHKGLEADPNGEVKLNCMLSHSLIYIIDKNNI